MDLRLQAMGSSIFLKMGPGICLSCTNAKGAPEASNLPAITECICECMNLVHISKICVTLNTE